jgi:predicted nucleic acid-binding protein
VTDRPPRVLDASTIVALFQGHQGLKALLDRAEQGQVQLLLPAAAIAEAERCLLARTTGWEAVLLSFGIASLSLTEHAAIESGDWPGDLAVRHSVHEARALATAVVTCDPAAYAGHQVSLLVL